MEASSSSGMLRRDPRRGVLETTTLLQPSFPSHHEQRRPGIYDLSCRALPDFPHGGQAVGALLSGEGLVAWTCLEFCKHGLEIHRLVALDYLAPHTRKSRATEQRFEVRAGW
jgi:hypothetical protein